MQGTGDRHHQTGALQQGLADPATDARTRRLEETINNAYLLFEHSTDQAYKKVLVRSRSGRCQDHELLVRLEVTDEMQECDDDSYDYDAVGVWFFQVERHRSWQSRFSERSLH